MPRKTRDYREGIHHLAPHASDSRVLFLDDGDRIAFLTLLDLTCTKVGVDIVSYVLMTNHYHLLAWTPDERMKLVLQHLHTEYSRGFNRRWGRSAHLFRAHAFGRPIEDDADLLTTERYFALNPVAAGIVMHPLDWRWGSARAHAGLAPSFVRLAERHLAGAFDNRPQWRKEYVAFIQPTRAAVDEHPVSDTAGTDRAAAAPTM